MDKQLLDEVIACLPQGRTLFHYYRDRYALYLLERKYQQGQLHTLADLKQSPFKSWLNRPLLKQWQASQGRADAPLGSLFYQASEQPHDTYLLSIGQWGNPKATRWQQTSRPGHNLVLHLNLPLQHQRWLTELGIDNILKLQRYSHPRDKQRITLAWARIDLDLDSNQALIEEVQSDWVRDMPWLFRRARYHLQNGRPQITWRNTALDCRRLLTYEAQLQPLEQTWSEAMLTAALWFLQEEIGIKEVFYHSWQTGIAVKRMSQTSAPPRSLYSELPERFCFTLQPEGPCFLENHFRSKQVKKLQAPWAWYHWAA